MATLGVVSSRISIPVDTVRDFCVRNHVRRLALFGSVLRDDFTDHGQSGTEPEWLARWGG